MTYRPIEACGVIGDLHSVALVSTDGTIDWCCLPSFDSPSIFAAILDENIGGHFKIWPEKKGSNRQMYRPETNILLTRFLREDGVGEIIDFMPVRDDSEAESEDVTHEIIRMVRSIRGKVQFHVECMPAFDFARAAHHATLIEGGVLFTAGSQRAVLLGDVEWSIRSVSNSSAAVCSFTLSPGKTVEFALRYLTEDGDSQLTAPVKGQQLLDETELFWHRWLKNFSYKGRWRERVARSALVLKLLTHHPTGAMIAAPTCSLPEEIGGERNWDYRYVWIRDAAFTVFALIRLGFTQEATAFFQWLQQRVHEEDSPTGPLNVMYSIDGQPDLPESTLDHFSGYRDSKPVRVGNDAHKQLQLDIYGELMDSIYLYDKHVTPIPYDLWQKLQKILDWVAANWQQADDGIWEVRSQRENFVYSKLQCWVALDRGIRLAHRRSLPLDHEHLKVIRDEIFESIMQNGWDKEKQCFVQSYETKVLDAANLLMPIVFFIAPNDPRMLSTLRQTMEQLTSDDLVYRYQLHGDRAVWDGLKGGEGTFSMCGFWLIEALTYAGKLEEAQFIFEKMLTYANHLGLYSEEISATGAALGNFPQAFTHLGLISAAIHLDEKLPR